MFKTYYRHLQENGKRNLTVIHEESNIKITSPDYFAHEKSDSELKKEVWEIMKLALKIFNFK